MKLIEMALSTGSIAAFPGGGAGGTAVVFPPEDEDKIGGEDEGNENEGNEEEEQICDSREHTGAGTIEKSVDSRDRKTPKN